MSRKNNVKSEREKIVLIGANAAGILNKMDSLHRIIKVFKPAVIFLQETKVRQRNKLKLNGYDIFENPRIHSSGGGLMTAIHKSLKAVVVTQDDDVEILTVEAKLNNMKVRFINGYGVQENSAEEQKRNFFQHLDLEIKKAITAGAMICIQMDSNAKLGQQFIPLDPKPISDNGILLGKIVEENNLVVVNGTSKCEGVITRYRKTINSVEESVLDHMIVCDLFFKLITKMTIDESGTYALTKYTNKRGDRTCKKESDHRTLIVEIDDNLNLTLHSQRSDSRIEIFDFRNKESFDQFLSVTTNNLELENCFENSDDDIEEASKKWLKMLNKLIKMSFNKIRLRNSYSNPQLDKLFQEKERLKEKLAVLSLPDHTS